ncbi:hypothetical protein ACOSP7_009513 [Xanthoceras sorbifolium]
MTRYIFLDCPDSTIIQIMFEFGDVHEHDLVMVAIKSQARANNTPGNTKLGKAGDNILGKGIKNVIVELLFSNTDQEK